MRSLLRPPDGISTSWWFVGLSFWVLVFLSFGLIVVRGSPASISDATVGWFEAQGRRAVLPGASRATGPAPDFKLPLFDGRTFQLADHRGQVVVVNFWASWCPPCRAEAPRLQAAYQAYRDRGVVFVGVDIQDTEDAARAFIDEFGLTYPNGPDHDLSITEAYGVTGIPTTFIIDREGRLRQRWQGEIQEAQLTGFVEEALR